MQSLPIRLLCLVLFTIAALRSDAQQLSKSDDDILVSLEQNTSYLADDRMEGRLMGSRGEKLAADFVKEYFQSLNLLPKGKNNYWMQPFSIKKMAYTGASILIKGNKEHKLEKVKPDANFPLPNTAVGKFSGNTIYVGYGLSAPKEGIDEYSQRKRLRGKFFVIKIGQPVQYKENQDVKKVATIQSKIDTAIAKGASGVIFINNDPETLEPDFKIFFKKEKMLPIPVYFMGTQHKPDSAMMHDAKVELNIDTNEIEITGNNVVGYWNNKAEKTIVIGAHYDHLGYNELGGSTYRKTENEKPQIHNGADDNASGTASIIELAELLVKSPFRNHNYLFVAFSGEEEGLLGSNQFVKEPPFELSKVMCMINLDMVGRLDSVKRTLAINGIGTSPVWKPKLDAVKAGNIKPVYSEGGTGSSDHTSFYYAGIPALHFFTGSHHNYHKPSDDAELLNYKGNVSVIKYIYSLIGALDTVKQMPFTKTREEHGSGSASSFKVTLGIMPDYLFDGKGVRVDGVTDGKPAVMAGIKAGDIITRLGSRDITDMESYMKALNEFDKGQTAKVKILRGGVEMEMNVTF